jgi:hypothetical protein
MKNKDIYTNTKKNAYMQTNIINDKEKKNENETNSYHLINDENNNNLSSINNNKNTLILDKHNNLDLNKNKKNKTNQTLNDKSTENGNLIHIINKTNKHSNNKLLKPKTDYTSFYDSGLKLQEVISTNETSTPKTTDSIASLFSNNDGTNQDKTTGSKKKTSAKSKINNIQSDLLVKQAFMKIANKDQSTINDEANLSIEKRATKRKNDKNDDEELREFMKTRPEFKDKKNLTEPLKAKLRILINNKKKLEQTERELIRDRARGLFDDSHSSHSSSSTLSHPNNVSAIQNASLNSSLTTTNNISIEVRRSVSSTPSPTNNESVIADDNKSGNIENNNTNVNLSIEYDNDEVFDITDENPFDLGMHRSKRIKSIEQSIYQDTFENIQQTIQNTKNEIQVTMNTISEISNELLKVEQIHENDQKLTLEIQTKQIESFRLECENKKVDKNIMESDIQTMMSRQETSRTKQAENNKDILINIQKRRENYQNKLNNLNFQLDALISQKHKSPTKDSINISSDQHSLNNNGTANNNQPSINTSQESSNENTILLENNILKPPPISNNALPLTSSNLMNIKTKSSIGSTVGQAQQLHSILSQTHHSSKDTTKSTINDTEKEQSSNNNHAAENKENNADGASTSNKNNNNHQTTSHKWPHFNLNGSSFETFKNSLNKNHNPFIFAREINKQISSETDFQLYLKSRNHDTDNKLAKQIEEISKPDGVRNDLLLPPRSSEDWYDLKYIRPSYDVYLVGDGLKNFTDDIYVRTS